MRLKSGSTTRGRLVAVVATAAALMLPSANDAAAQMRGGFGGGGFGAGGFGGGGFGGANFGRGISPAGAMPNRMVDPAGRLPTVSRTGAAKRLTATTDRKLRQQLKSHAGRKGTKLATTGEDRRMRKTGRVAGCEGECPRPKRPERPSRPGGRPVVVDLPITPLRGRPVFVSPYQYVSSSLNSNLPPSGPSASQQPPGGGRVSGVPPAGERRYVPDQVLAVLQDGLTETQIGRFLRERRLARTADGVRRLALINARVFRLRIVDGAPVPRVVAALERDPRVVFAQPNYLFALAQAQEAAAAVPAGVAPAAEQAPPSVPSLQYAIAKLQVPQAHQLARGARVLVAVIDSRVDAEHPELAGAIAKLIDVVNDKDPAPHLHGTAMAGAIVAKSRLIGIAPEARLVAVRAFTAKAGGSASSTSLDLSDALDRAVQEGVRVINLSFAGPADPIVATSLKAAHGRGIVLVAAAGNAGPKSPPLYPGADPNVIAVTATDADDNVYQGANRGRYIAVAAPGVDVLVPAPRASYELSTGTSVAAAHVSGVAALLLAHNPSLDPDRVRKILTESAQGLGPAGSIEDYGSGLADAYKALMAADPNAPGAPAATGVATH